MDYISWQKTSAGAHKPSYAYEFTASAPNGIDVGHIYRIDGGPLNGRWSWMFLLGHSQFRQGIMSGDQASRQRAADQVQKTYERYLETPGCEGGGQSRIPIKRPANQNETV